MLSCLERAAELLLWCQGWLLAPPLTLLVLGMGDGGNLGFPTPGMQRNPHSTASPHSLGGSFSISLLQELKPSLQPGVAHGKFIYSLLFLPASPLSLNSSSLSLLLTPDVFIESNQICAEHQANQAGVVPPWEAVPSAWPHFKLRKRPRGVERGCSEGS